MRLASLAFAIPTLLLACAAPPQPSPASLAPASATASDQPASPAASPSASPEVATTIACVRRSSRPGTLACDKAVEAALAALKPSHEPILTATFVSRLPCPINARCAATLPTIGFVILTSAAGTEVVRLDQGPTGLINATGPTPYVPPDGAFGQVQYDPPVRNVDPGDVVCPGTEPCGP
jgi:hypothetical protein